MVCFLENNGIERKHNILYVIIIFINIIRIIDEIFSQAQRIR